MTTETASHKVRPSEVEWSEIKPQAEESQAALKAQSTCSRWLKFNLVGGIGVAVQFAVLFFLKSVLHFRYLWATGVAVEIAVVHNFFWHERFTWVDRMRFSDPAESRWKQSTTRLVRFNLANGAVSILGNVSLMRLMVGEGHMNYLAANAIAIALCSMANFVVSDSWVFENGQPRIDRASN